MTFTPTQLARIQRTLHPRPITPKTGLEPLCRAQNVSHASARKLIRSGRSQAEAIAYCKAQGLIFVPRGKSRWEAREKP